jgi:hypothetical protein
VKDLIYNQRKIPKDQWRYGFRTSADTGCGWIATYNALRLLGYRVEPEQLIRYYERQLPLIHGNAGTSFWGPAVCMKQLGFPVDIVIDRKKFDETARESDVCILFYRWHQKYRFGAHFVTLRYKDGRFIGYNTFRSSQGPDNWGESIDEFMTKNHFFGAVLIGIRDKRVEK